jgi:hypothetical protein
MTTDHPAPPADLVAESLNLLAAAHYVLAFVTALMTPAGLYLAYIGWGLLHPERGAAWTPRPGQELLDPLRWGAVFFMGGGVLATLSLLHAALLAYVGRCIARRRRRRFCLMFSIFDLTYFPLGTVLGVFALFLLLKPQAKQEFAQSGTPRAAPSP